MLSRRRSIERGPIAGQLQIFCASLNELWQIMANRQIAQRTLGDVSYTGSGGVGGVGDCTRPLPTKSYPRETSGPRIDRIPPTRPPWRDRQYRELKKSIFSAPSKCPIVLFGPQTNRTILKRLHVVSKLVCLTLVGPRRLLSLIHI